MTVVTLNGCRNCKHVFAEGAKKFCRRYPPTVQLVPSPQGVQVVSSFPPVQDQMSCGEYERSIIKAS